MNYEDAEHILETYSIQELLEINELTEVDLLIYIVEQEFIQLPSVKPI